MMAKHNIKENNNVINSIIKNNNKYHPNCMNQEPPAPKKVLNILK